MHRQIPLLIVLIVGVFMALQYYVPHPYSKFSLQYSLDWIQIIGIFAAPLGIASMVRVNAAKVQRRSSGWGFSLLNLAGLATMIVLGVLPGALNQGSPFMQMFTYIYIPVQATMFSLLAFFIATAAYRAFRARSAMATIVLASAIIVMLGRVPIGEAIHPWLPQAASFIMNVPNMAGFRAIMIGLGLGGVAMGMKIVLGIERSYMGRD